MVVLIFISIECNCIHSITNVYVLYTWCVQVLSNKEKKAIEECKEELSEHLMVTLPQLMAKVAIKLEAVVLLSVLVH